MKNDYSKKIILIITLAILITFIVINEKSFFSDFLASKIPVTKENYPELEAELSYSPYNYSLVDTTISERNIFNLTGEFIDLEKEVFDLENEDPSEKPCTKKNLPFKVLGIISSNRPKSGVVTIVNALTQKTEVYKPGQTISGDLSFIGAIENRAEFFDGQDKICLAIGPKKSPSRSQYSSPKTDSINLSRQLVDEGLGEGFVNIIETAQLMPAFEGRKFIGIKIFDLKDDSLLSQIQLQKEDTIVKVNNIALDDPSKGFELFRALKEDSAVEFQVLRGGSLMIKKVTIK